MPVIQIINRTRRVRDARWQHMLPALQAQITHDFQPKWGIGGTLTFVGRKQKPDPALWKLWLMDTSPEPGALGFHEDDTGVPEGKVFVEDDLRYGAEITVTVSHELLEMLADPLATKMTKTVGGISYAIEACDPVEADSDGYLIGDVRVSDFVTPFYFGLPNADGSKIFDQRTLLNKPVPAMRPGGYQLWFNGTYHSTMARYEDGTLSQRAIRSEGRTIRRAAA